MTEQLKPCPFCGNDGSGPVEDALQICETDMEGRWKAPMAYSVQCDKCTATMGYSESEDEAIEAWNRRAALTVTPQEAAKVPRLTDAEVADLRLAFVDHDDERDEPLAAVIEWYIATRAISEDSHE